MANRILSKMDHIRHTRGVLNASYEVLEKVHDRLRTHEYLFGYSRNKSYHLPDDLKISVENTTITQYGFNQMTPMMIQKYREDLAHTLDSYLNEEGMSVNVSNDKHTLPGVVVTVHKDTFNKRA